MPKGEGKDGIQMDENGDYILPIKNMDLFKRLLEWGMIHEIRPGVWDLKRKEVEEGLNP